MSNRYTRREMLRLSGRAAIFAGLIPHLCRGEKPANLSTGVVIAADPTAAQVGNKVLADGGNAVDAAAAAALTACVVSPANCGPGGYGGHATIGLARQKKITSIDFNTAAPAAARPDMFPRDSKGNVIGGINDTGWLASGVPGILAGIQMAVERYGTRPLGQLLAPAITLARQGFPVSHPMAVSLKANAAKLKAFPGSAKTLFKPDGEPYAEGDLYRNPDLAALLDTLAQRNSVDAFYRGDIAHRIAEEFQKHGGLVTAKDLADYAALEVAPLELEWNGLVIHTAPLTAGGLTVVEALNILKAMGWGREKAGAARSHGKLEALRLAWHDRYSSLGDPAKADVPVEYLLSWDYALESAKAIEKAVRQQQPLLLQTGPDTDNGTANITAVDSHGNMVAMTITHGNAFGSKVTAEGLGLTLGHGMSRFNPLPGKPNSVAPGKRPLNNMCPTVVTHRGTPVFAVGGAGGKNIPNCIYDVLWGYVGLRDSLETAMTRPRLTTEGGMAATVEQTWPADELAYLKSLDFQITQAGAGGSLARVGAVTFDPASGQCAGKLR
jgi:gamma-glutamyltranspeptidase/glutathione hydrolase